jgi:hypothetical protein
MKQSQLKELVKHITKSVLKEFTLMSASSQRDNSTTDMAQDPSVPPTDAMTSAEKARDARDKEHQRQQAIKQQSVELDAKKKEMDFNKRKLDQQKRFDIPNATKELQKLKGARI